MHHFHLFNFIAHSALNLQQAPSQNYGFDIQKRCDEELVLSGGSDKKGHPSPPPDFSFLLAH